MTRNATPRAPAGQTPRSRPRLPFASLIVLLFAASLAVQAALASRGASTASGTAAAPDVEARSFVLSFVATFGDRVSGRGPLGETLSLAVFGLCLVGASWLLRRTARRPSSRPAFDASRTHNVAVLTPSPRRASGETTLR